MKSVFIISLDLELMWGAINTENYALITLLKKAGGGRYRKYIDFLLDAMERYEIPATWATVGHLFLDNCKSENGVPHPNMPRPRDDWYRNDPCTNLSQNSLYYGKDIIEKILSNSVEHEIGYHSFSHPIFSEITRGVAEAEIRKGIELAKDFGIDLKSFVFPHNKIGHLDVLKENGFKIFRGKPPSRYNIRQNLLNRIINGAINKLIALPVSPIWKNGIWMIPSSMSFFDPLIPFSRLPRAKYGLDRAIHHGQVFHIWMHPWNLLSHKSLKRDIEVFLRYVARKRDQGEIEVMTMGNFSDQLDERVY